MGVRDHLTSIGHQIGRVRWASERLSWNLHFDGLAFDRFINPKTLVFSQADFIAALLGHQGGRTLPLPSGVAVEAELHNKVDADVWHLCCGHDLCAILSVGLQKVLGQNCRANVSAGRLEMMLRLAFEKDYFRQTVLRDELARWEQVRGKGCYVVL
jgi:hypothetical protein